MAEIPGKGLPWPRSLQALLRTFVSKRHASRELGIPRTTLLGLANRHTRPSPHTREKFLALGWADAELPEEKDPSHTAKAITDESSYADRNGSRRFPGHWNRIRAHKARVKREALLFIAYTRVARQVGLSGHAARELAYRKPDETQRKVV